MSTWALSATRRHLSQVRAAPFILERSLLLLSLNHWVYAVNLTFDLISVSCAHVWMWLWTVLCFWHTHFWIFYDKQSKPLVAVCVCVWGGCHCSGATPPSNGQIAALHMWDSNAPTSGLNHMKSTRSAISAAIHSLSQVQLRSWLFYMFFTPRASLLMWRVFNEELESNMTKNDLQFQKFRFEQTVEFS